MDNLQDILEMNCGEVVRNYGLRPMSASRNLRSDLQFYPDTPLENHLPDKDNWHLTEMSTKELLYVVADGNVIRPGELTMDHFSVDYHPENRPKIEEIDRFNQQ